MSQDDDKHTELKRQIDADVFAAIAIAGELLLVAVAWLVDWLWPGDVSITAQWSLDAIRTGVLATLPLLALLALFTWTPLRKLAPLERIRERLRGQLGETLANLRLWQIAAISCAASLGEEFLFRGALQPRVGLIAASVFFGALHWISFTYFVLASLAGLYLGWLLNASGALLAPMVVHALYDFVALLVIRHEMRRERRDVEDASTDKVD